MNKSLGKPACTAASWPWEEACCGVMASALGDGLAVLDHSFGLITCNEAFKALMGRESVASGDHVPDMFPASCRDELRRVLAAARDGEPCRAELGLDEGLLQADEPQGLRALASVTPLPCNPGRPAAIGLLLVDVSALIEAREARNRETLRALRESERTGWTLLNATLDSAFLFDRDGVIHAANEHAARKLGVSEAKAMVGRRMSEYFPPHVFERRLANLRRVFDTGKPLRVEDERADIIFDNNLFPVFDEHGNVSKVAVFGHDITKRRQSEVQLRKRAFQQGVVAELGIFALSNLSLRDILDKTCRLAAMLFEADFCEVLEVVPGQDDLLLTAGVGWNASQLGTLRVSLSGTLAGLALSSNAPAVVEDVCTDTRLSEIQTFLDHRIASGMSVVIHGTSSAFGVLGVHSVRKRRFSGDEVNTLQSVANVLSEAVARFQAEKTLQALSERNTAILGSVAQGIFGVDEAGLITFANPAVEKLTGFSGTELSGANAHWLLHHTRPDGSVYTEEACPITHTLADGQLRHVEEDVYWRKDGTSFPVDYSCTPLFSQDRLEGAVVVFEDVTERKRAQERLRRLAFFDELTGLPNRSQFKLRLESALDRSRPGAGFAVLFLDLDDFKVVNDGLGHSLGDRLLRSISQRLRSAIGPRGLLARLGGDEFAVLLEDMQDPKEAMAMAGRIHKELASPERLEDYEIFISASVGLVLNEGHYQNIEDILRDADTAMFQAKTLGKGENMVFDKAMHDEVRSRLMLENDLRRALERDELFLVYQPIVNLSDLRPSGFEALLRWQHPERGLVSPMEFIPVAEATGLILRIGEWVLAQACARLASWRRSIPGMDGLSMSVNLSGRQFMQRDLLGRISRILEDTGLPPSVVKLEITESVLMENAERAAEMLGEIKNLGLSVMIDDFGTGYSSLAYLRRFPVDALKVDRAFVRNLDTDRDNLHIVKAVVQLAHSLEMAVVAEGIETVKELAVLRSLRCGMGQGYHFARPLSAGAAQEYLRQALA
ncbi:EAL domain-containing protein [Fundidesulfovibrio putealis]|uniref:EAL domain-containing protein n=1 Tax=Fundidesulfovibrio putealis TaxID=270496 RepID=UPI00040439EA|nr:EAL domain-containing protein [Fundidesulfovibrio putealis]